MSGRAVDGTIQPWPWRTATLPKHLIELWRDDATRDWAAMSSRLAQFKSEVLAVSTATGARLFSVLGLALFGILTARSLGPTDRGVVVVLVAGASLAMVLASCGQYVVARADLTTGSPAERALSADQYVTWAAIVSFSFALPLAVIAIALPPIRTSLDPKTATIFLILVPSLLFARFVKDGLYSLDLGPRSAMNEAIGAGLVVAVWLAGTSLVGLEPTPLFAILCYSVWPAVDIAGGMVSLWPVRWKIPQGSRERLIRGLPALASVAAQAAVLRVDRLLLGALAGKESAGLYAGAATFAEALWILPIMLGQFIFGQAAGGVSTSHLRKRRRLAIGISSVGAVVISLFAEDAILLLLGTDFVEAAVLVPWLSLAAVFGSSYHIDVAAARGRGRNALAAAATTAGLLVMVIMDVLLIPEFEQLGAAWGTLGGYATMALWMMCRDESESLRRP